MTAIRESRSAPPPSTGAPNWSACSAFGSTGVPLWTAVLLATVPTAIGTVLDILIWAQPGMLFKACFFIGCVLAVLLVKRQSVFGPMVQPPLVLTIIMPLLVLLTGSGQAAGAGGTAKALAVARPLISSFPIMAGATIVALGIGLIRMFVTQPARHRPEVADSDEPTKKRRPVAPPRKKPAEEKRHPEASEGAARPQRAQPERGRPQQAPGRPRSGETPKPRGDAPGRARGAEPREGRGAPRRGAAPRQAPGRPRAAEPPQGEPPRRPRRPR